MKVLLIKDVYKLGRAGDVKRVADGYGRNYLLPQGLAVLATPQALLQTERIREQATTQRELVNKEMSALAKKLEESPFKAPERTPPEDDGKPENVRLSFGKHKGLALGEVPSQYLEWLVGDFQPKTSEQNRIITAAQELLGMNPFAMPVDDIPF